jgi:hypothetical protein
MKKTDREFERYIKHKNSVCTTGCSQDIEVMYDVKEKEREGNKSKKSLFPLLGKQLRCLK